MPDWRDDLPPIPSDEILRNVRREGALRRARQRERRQRLYMLGGTLAAAAALVAFVSAGFVLGPSGDDDDAGPATDAAATVPAGGTSEETTGGTAAATAATTGGAAATTGAPADTTAAGAGTTIGGTEPTSDTTTVAAATTTPASPEVTVSGGDLWERPAAGGTPCGPTTLDITFAPEAITLESAVVLGGHPRRDPIEMTVDDNEATARIGPFGPDAVSPGNRRELPITVRYVDAGGVTGFVRPVDPVFLRDCTP